MKRSAESFSRNFLWGWKQAHVVSSRGTAYLCDIILQVNLKIQWVQDTLKWEGLRMLFWSANFGNRELRMVQKILEICLSETHASWNREVWIKDLSFQANVDSRCKGDNGKEWEEVINKAHKTRRQRKSTLLHWWASATFKSTNASRRMFARAIPSVEIIKPRRKSGTRTSREDRWIENLNWHNH